jgi:hypothetical protein
MMSAIPAIRERRESSDLSKVFRKPDILSRRQRGESYPRLLVDKQSAAKEEAEKSIWRTVEDIERESASRWVNAHATWGHSLDRLLQAYPDWAPLGREPRSGDLAMPIREALRTLQVVLKTVDRKVHFAEPGDPKREPAYLKNFVAFTKMLPVPET